MFVNGGVRMHIITSLLLSLDVCREFKLISRGTPEYTVTKEDVGLRLMFIYTPINAEGD